MLVSAVTMSCAEPGADMRRREFITLLGGAAAAWPLGARAQQPEPMRRIGVLMNRAADDLEGQAGRAAFQQGLQQLGWSDGRNVRIDTRWGGDDVERERRYAEELAGWASGSPALGSMQLTSKRHDLAGLGVAQ